MSSVPYIYHGVNGYSRYDTPQNIGFTASPGIAYVARCEFLNSRDVTYIQSGCVCRAEPSVVPTFTPYQVRLHRFFVPMQLYHPEMRVNSANFDIRTLSCNVLPRSYALDSTDINYSQASEFDTVTQNKSSLLYQLNLSSGFLPLGDIRDMDITYPVSSRTWPVGTSLQLGGRFVNADPVLAYWDIVRSYYSYSQTDQFFLASPDHVLPSANPGGFFQRDPYNDVERHKFKAYECSLRTLDRYYESSFYPLSSDTSRFYDRTDLSMTLANSYTGSLSYKTSSIPLSVEFTKDTFTKSYTWSDFNVSSLSAADLFTAHYPLAVIPSAPDRYSRLLPSLSGEDVSLQSINTVRQLAVAARLQEYTDLLSSGGSRFTDWLKTFFAASVKHVDRPLLLFAGNLFVNSQPIFNNASSPGDGLGAFGGIFSAQGSFSKKGQRYCFDEPGYLIDILSIRPLYYWSGLQADYARYDALDYFNPLFNEVGYQSIPNIVSGLWPTYRTVPIETAFFTSYKEPCFNEFRSSYDYVFGDFALTPYTELTSAANDIIRSSWVQQRSAAVPRIGVGDVALFSGSRFVDLNTCNLSFSAATIDNFFINMYYNVSKKSLVSKSFATRLCSR